MNRQMQEEERYFQHVERWNRQAAGDEQRIVRKTAAADDVASIVNSQQASALILEINQ